MIFHQIQGERVPALGFGTYRLQGQECVQGVLDALATGYRHIDTAQSYENESEVGQALALSSVPRGELFLVSKVRPRNYASGRARDSVHESLKRLGVDRIDLMLLHWPNMSVPLEQPLTDLAALQQEGLVRHVGVSNFPTALVRQASQVTRIFCNQVEYHPFLAQERILEQARELDLLVTAYRPLANGLVGNEPVLQQIGKRYDKSPEQVALRWSIQQPRVATIPKSASAARRASNFDLFDFSLTAEEMAAVHALASGHRLVSPEDGPEWDA